MDIVNLIFYNILTSINATDHKYIPKEAEFYLEKIGHQRKKFQRSIFLELLVKKCFLKKHSLTDSRNYNFLVLTV